MPARKPHTKNYDEKTRLAKNKIIREKGMETRQRRATMTPQVRDLKIIETKLNSKQKEALKNIFHEYKWIRNSALEAQRFDIDYIKELNNTVKVKTPNGIEERTIETLGSQMQQSVITELKSNLKTLTVLKKKGKKVGGLKFVRNVKSINLQQFGVTYKLLKDSKGRYSSIKVQNIPGRLRIRGFEQLDVTGIEFANAKLVKRADGLHLLVTTYVPKVETIAPSGELGVDFGVNKAFVFSDGSSVNLLIGESEKLRRLHRKLSRQVRNSNGYKRTLDRIAREYLRVGNQKDDAARKLVGSLTRDNVVYFQDENITSWKNRKSGSRGSRKIQHGLLGRVKTLLKGDENAVMLPRWVATTAWCSECGVRTTHGLDERVFECSSCGFSEDRDVHAAKNMIILGKKYKLFTSGIEGSAGGVRVRLEEYLYKVDLERLAAKPETVNALGSP